jgi:hypothetical protein
MLKLVEAKPELDQIIAEARIPAVLESLYALQLPDAYLGDIALSHGRWQDADGALMITNAEPVQKSQHLAAQFDPVGAYISRVVRQPRKQIAAFVEMADRFGDVDDLSAWHSGVLPPDEIIASMMRHWSGNHTVRSKAVENYIAKVAGNPVKTLGEYSLRPRPGQLTGYEHAEVAIF